MTWPRWSFLPRVLAALLALAAAFTYPLRSNPGAGKVAPHPLSATAHTACPEPMGDRPPTPHAPGGHRGHCLFCLTGAFATAPGPALLLVLPARRPGRVPPPTPRAVRLAPIHADARAPPRALA